MVPITPLRLVPIQHNTYIPGEEMQIDFAGDALWLTDPKTGELTKVVVLVCILPYSGRDLPRLCTTLPWRTSSAVYPMPSLTSAEQLA